MCRIENGVGVIGFGIRWVLTQLTLMLVLRCAFGPAHAGRSQATSARFDGCAQSAEREDSQSRVLSTYYPLPLHISRENSRKVILERWN
jgi:hypothetical protein